ncbi:uncharacterized protein EI90DRAFT_2557596 [Cantharellus anzutake]|uniref:uncharacterized protein n=1 Tax=Cantharellus anzutake TaxID=1750568 RepID=UPI0019040E25|nr:uncharacterized protein EI90DRAFT_2557596 [Cantharellus anzutake]KAF8338177.1 hypothetical protein EI90DRAFT_2557596 [Cantharellus anzutake]
MNHSSNIPDDDYPSARDDLDDPRSRTRHFAGTVAVPSLPGAMEHLSRRQSAPNPGDSPLQPSFPSPTHQYGPRIGQVAAQPHLHGYVDSQTRSHSYHSSNSQWTSTGGGQPNQASLPQPPYTTSDAHTSTMPYPSHSHLHDYASDVSNQRSSHFYEPSHPNTRVDIPPYHYQSPTSGVMSHDHLGMRPSSFAYSGPVGVRSSQACVACRKRKVRPGLRVFPWGVE